VGQALDLVACWLDYFELVMRLPSAYQQQTIHQFQVQSLPMDSTLSMSCVLLFETWQLRLLSFFGSHGWICLLVVTSIADSGYTTNFGEIQSLAMLLIGTSCLQVHLFAH